MQKKLLMQAEHIALSFGEQKVLDIDRFAVYQGERIGLVGANGAGKTTFLRVLSGELEPDAGTVKRMCDVHFFRQFSEGIDPFELEGKEMKAMRIQDKVWQETVSGGEDTRMRLAWMFSSGKMLVFLDEPTANLDIKGIALLKQKLLELDTMVIVSHDRALLNALCTRIVEIRNGQLASFEGNYDDYTRQKEQNIQRQWTEYENYTSEKKRLEKVYLQKKQKAASIEKLPKGMTPREAGLRNFLSKHPKDAKAGRMEASAKNVLERLEHMEVKEKPRELPRMRPDFRLTDPPENAVVIRGEGICFSYENGGEIFRDASFQIRNRSRVAVVGANGAGKTTLLKLITREYPLEKGSLYVVPKASIGLLSQNMASLDYGKTVLENVMEDSVQNESIARTILARLLLSAQDMGKDAGVLSGGERIKLAFAKLFVGKANVLILDEPTNYLDIPSVEALEEMFAEYEGVLVFVSHDEAFIRACATEILEVKDGKTVPYLGTPEEFFGGRSR
ncbi:ribosomal protection-like ABC-F family protein [uncultured Acetatifactor sp.]|uniref:ribosomal protection-like ABC-F family protein n=1 Tax=uncultured Acetatifactor sp. TaxID=1671927 RepID=UPI0026298879|nr:ABC-F type ribosomal protection protein [uncultured Acetatifactor sp.]